MTYSEIGFAIWGVAITVLLALVVVRLGHALSDLRRIRETTNKTYWIVAREELKK